MSPADLLRLVCGHRLRWTPSGEVGRVTGKLPDGLRVQWISGREDKLAEEDAEHVALAGECTTHELAALKSMQVAADLERRTRARHARERARRVVEPVEQDADAETSDADRARILEQIGTLQAWRRRQAEHGIVPAHERLDPEVRERKRLLNAKRIARLVEAGLCVKCALLPARAGQRRCTPCAEENVRAVKASVARRQGGVTRAG
jgi:hypothetical protein